MSTDAGELLEHRVRVVDVVEQEHVQLAEVVDARRDDVRVDALEAEHAQWARVQSEQHSDEFDDLHLD